MSHKKTRVKPSVKEMFLFFSFFFWKILISKCFFSLFVRKFWVNLRCDLGLSSFVEKSVDDYFFTDDWSNQIELKDIPRITALNETGRLERFQVKGNR